MTALQDASWSSVQLSCSCHFVQNVTCPLAREAGEHDSKPTVACAACSVKGHVDLVYPVSLVSLDQLL